MSALLLAYICASYMMEVANFVSFLRRAGVIAHDIYNGLRRVNSEF